MMMNYFWNGHVLQDFIFENFNATSSSGFAGICVALLSISILCEGIYFLKKHLLQRFLYLRRLSIRRRRQEHSSSGSHQQGTHENNEAPDTDASPRNSLLQTNENSENESNERISYSNYFSKNPEFFLLFSSSLLHVIYTFLGFTIMNAVMSFNVGVLVSVCLGFGIGYFVFRTEVDFEDGDKSSAERNSIETIPCPQSPLESESCPKTEIPSSAHQRQGSAQGSSGHNSKQGHRISPNDNDQGVEEELGGSTPKNSGLVLVVGAEVHSNYQQSL